MKAAIGAVGAIAGCCALHLGVAATVAGLLWSWTGRGAVVSVALLVGLVGLVAAVRRRGSSGPGGAVTVSTSGEAEAGRL